MLSNPSSFFRQELVGGAQHGAEKIANGVVVLAVAQPVDRHRSYVEGLGRLRRHRTYIAGTAVVPLP